VLFCAAGYAALHLRLCNYRPLRDFARFHAVIAGLTRNCLIFNIVFPSDFFPAVKNNSAFPSAFQVAEMTALLGQPHNFSI